MVHEKQETEIIWLYDWMQCEWLTGISAWYLRTFFKFGKIAEGIPTFDFMPPIRHPYFLLGRAKKDDKNIQELPGPINGC